MFHVKQAPALRLPGLLTDAEIAKDHVEDVFDINPAGEAAQRAGGETQFFGEQILALGDWPTGGSLKSGEGVFQCPPMPRPGDQRRFGPGQELGRVPLQCAEEGGNSRSGRR